MRSERKEDHHSPFLRPLFPATRAVPPLTIFVSAAALLCRQLNNMKGLSPSDEHMRAPTLARVHANTQDAHGEKHQLAPMELLAKASCSSSLTHVQTRTGV